MSSDAMSMPADSPSEPDDGFSDDAWDAYLAEPYEDPAGADPFSAEIENVDTSAWDVDSSLLWGDEGDASVDGGDALGLDLPL